MAFMAAIMLVLTTFVFTMFTIFTVLVFPTIPVAVFARAAVPPFVLAMRFVPAVSFMPLAVAHGTLVVLAPFTLPHRVFAHFPFAHFPFAHRVLFVFAALLVPSLGLVQSFMKVPHELGQFIELAMDFFDAGHRRAASEVAAAQLGPVPARTWTTAGRTPRTLAALGATLVARSAIALAIQAVALLAPRAVAAVITDFKFFLFLVFVVFVFVVVIVGGVVVMRVFLVVVLVAMFVPVLGSRLVFRAIGRTGVIFRLIVDGLCAERKFDNPSAVPFRMGYVVGQRKPIRAVDQLFDQRAEPCKGFVEGTIVIWSGKQAAADK